MTAVPQPEPTIADVLGAIHGLDVRLGEQVESLRLEVRDLRAELVGFKLDTNMRLTTLFDELAAFRAEYNQHEHGG